MAKIFTKSAPSAIALRMNARIWAGIAGLIGDGSQRREDTRARDAALGNPVAEIFVHLRARALNRRESRHERLVRVLTAYSIDCSGVSSTCRLWTLPVSRSKWSAICVCVSIQPGMTVRPRRS